MKRKPKILVVGSLVMDLIVTAPKLPQEGETLLGTSFHTAPGGKGANQAVQAARLGADVTMVGRIGNDDFGMRMKRSLEESGVNTEHLMLTENTSSAVGNIQLENRDNGETANRILVISGANMKITPEDVAFLKEEIADYDMAILQYEIPMKINEIVSAYAYDKHIPVMVNPAPSAFTSRELLSHTTYYAPNEHEAEDLTGMKVSTEADAEKASRIMLDRGAQNVIITRGSEGASFMNSNSKLQSPCIPTKEVVDPTAAGDSFIGAFCFATCVGADCEDALRFANYTAHITVSRMGAQPSLPWIDEVIAEMTKDGIDCSRYV